jgi:hypothetical protein
MLEVMSEFLGWLVCDVFLTLTGEGILYTVTLGRHKIRWDLYADEPATKSVVFSELSFWIGVAFWIAVIALVYRLLR